MTHKLNLKVFLENSKSITDAQIVPIFHSWIQGHALEEHALFDVADYSHVHHGPGVVLVSHEANLYLDHGDGRSGLLYQRKQPIAGVSGLGASIAVILKYLLSAAEKLEEATEGKAKSSKREFVLRFADRLNAPNTAETFAKVRGEVEGAFTPLLRAVTLEHVGDSGKLLEVRVKAKE